MGESLRRVAAPHAAKVFAERHVAHVEQSVFDVPVPARQRQQFRRAMGFARQGGDGVDHLSLTESPEFAASFDANDLREAFPPGVEIGRQSRARGEDARLNASVPGVDMLMPREVGRIDPPDALAGTAGEP